MVQEDPSLWEIEPRESFLPDHLLYRGLNENLWRKWDDINIIEQNIYSIPDESGEEYTLSLDWCKYCDNPRLTLARLYTVWYARKHGLQVEEAIIRLRIQPSSNSEYGLCVEDLKITPNIISEARKNYGIAKMSIEKLNNLINEGIGYNHDPIKEIPEQIKETMSLEMEPMVFKKLIAYAKVQGVPINDYIQTVLREHVIKIEGDPIQLFRELGSDGVLEFVYNY